MYSLATSYLLSSLVSLSFSCLCFSFVPSSRTSSVVRARVHRTSTTSSHFPSHFLCYLLSLLGYRLPAAAVHASPHACVPQFPVSPLPACPSWNVHIPVCFHTCIHTSLLHCSWLSSCSVSLSPFWSGGRSMYLQDDRCCSVFASSCTIAQPSIYPYTSPHSSLQLAEQVFLSLNEIE